MKLVRRAISIACSRMWNDMIFVTENNLDFDDKFGSTCNSNSFWLIRVVTQIREHTYQMPELLPPQH